MLGYFIQLAVRSLRRNVVLTALMIAAVGVGIGASMTMLTTLITMSGDPIPDKSSQLFLPQIDSFGDASRTHDMRDVPYELPYPDALAFMEARQGVRQTAMYPMALNVKPAQGDLFQAAGRATYADFFAMFEVPFRSGAAWGHREDADQANVVVLSSTLADRLFPGVDAVGKTVNLGKRDYRVSGVAAHWTPTPRFYDTNAGGFDEPEEFYIPFSTAIDRQIETDEYACDATSLAARWDARLKSDCPWVQFWVELPQAAQVAAFRRFLQNYAAEQHRLGRYPWLPVTAMYDVMGWMDHVHVVPSEVRVNSMIAGGFLIVCLINAVGLMLAKFSSRAVELSVRRALGASRNSLFLQCVTESLLIGFLGGLLGLSLTGVGLSALRDLRGITHQDSTAGHLASLNIEIVLITFGVSILATICSGLYPALRASRVQPAWQLKAQ
jgi:putative ABC transport system permease protein